MDHRQTCRNDAPAINARKLEDYFSRSDSAVIAYSGGVDSALLAFAAHRVLGKRMTAVIADSPSLSRREFRFARKFAGTHGIPLQIIRTQEIENPLYRANTANRCYFCKKALFEKIGELRNQIETVLDAVNVTVFYGANLDDLDDYRPGMQAAQEEAIKAPFIDLGFGKDTIRAICSYYGLEVADKPAMPCMASRIRYGTEVSPENLSQVENAENLLYGIGLNVFRVRHHGDTARIEIMTPDFDVLLKHRETICKKLHESGFIYVVLDLDGFKSGSLNANIAPLQNLENRSEK